jgi:2-keto-4-pentenoate hydratase/2-oxohepta-3-ene-1,7-dioic acid hydratase in catechol pathway
MSRNMMKFVRFISAGHADGIYGLVNDNGSIELIKGGLFDPIEKTGEVINESVIIRYLPPIDPVNVLAVGLNYTDHAVETKENLPSEPLLFIKATTTVTAHGENILLPKMAPDKVDYEAELAVIISKKAHNVPIEDALDYAFGYTCANDATARDCQAKDGQWARGKSFDTFAPLGPHVVTGIDPRNLHVRMILNGQVMQDQSTADMVFDVPYLISHLSRCMTLLPGTVILTGTPSGVGFTRKPPVYLKPGDVCEVDIENIGILRNTVAEEK